MCVSVHVVQHGNLQFLPVKYEADLRVFVSCLHCFPRYTGNWIYWPRYHAGQPQLSELCLLHESPVYLPCGKIRSAQLRSREGRPPPPHTHTHISRVATFGTRALPAAWISCLFTARECKACGKMGGGGTGGWLPPHMVLADFVLFFTVNRYTV